MFHGQYVPVKIGRKLILMWDGQRTIAFRNSHVNKFISDMKKAFSETRKKIKAQQKRNLEYFGIFDNELLNQCVKYYFDKFVESKDQTEIAKKSGKDIFGQ